MTKRQLKTEDRADGKIKGGGTCRLGEVRLHRVGSGTHLLVRRAAISSRPAAALSLPRADCAHAL